MLPYLLALGLGVAAALVLGCGQDRSNLIPPANAQALIARLDAVRTALDSGRCAGIGELVAQAKASAGTLDASVDRRLRARINQGIRALERRAPADCEEAVTTAPETQTETIPTVTIQTDTTPTATVPTDTTPTATT